MDFDLMPGEVHALAGENGAGKSTFIKIISGAYTPDTGEIEIAGEHVRALTTHRAQQLGIAVVYQEFNLLPDLTIAENMFIGQLPGDRFGSYSPRRAYEASRQILAQLGSSIDPNRLVGELSVAEQQMVEIGKALAMNFRIIIMDEPSTVLAGEELDQLHRVVRRLRDDGRSVIYISHRLDEVLSLADRITVFKDGERIRTADAEEWDHDSLIHAMIGRDLVDFFPDRAAPGEKELFRVDGLTVTGKIFDVSISVSRGEIVGIAGLGGSGKTTLCRALVGLETRSDGTVEMDGDPVPASPRQCAAAGLVMVPEDRKLQGIFAGRSLAFNLTISALDRLKTAFFLSFARETRFVGRSMVDFDIRPANPALDIAKLSGGNQQKVVLARWLSRDPKVVVLDEPTRGVDVGAKAEIYALIEKLAESGAAILIASSDVTELLGVCDRILVFHQGRLVEDLTRKQASEEAIIRAATIAPEPGRKPVLEAAC
ncbi:sugar ABC transporter ATP-binding protein [Hoeflea sp. CAU 1731]